MLGEDFGGFVISDRYAGYHFLLDFRTFDGLSGDLAARSVASA
ncbi:MAG: hypothetical protein ACYCUM_12710 [Solirubrobacteraceae bacterium]